jgi:hypothetical protein
MIGSSITAGATLLSFQSGNEKRDLGVTLTRSVGDPQGTVKPGASAALLQGQLRFDRLLGIHLARHDNLCCRVKVSGELLFNPKCGKSTLACRYVD